MSNNSPTMTVAEFKAYLRSKRNAKAHRNQIARTWLVVKREGKITTPIGVAVFRGMALPFKLGLDWRKLGLYVKGGENGPTGIR
jgi:hypothetical protein